MTRKSYLLAGLLAVTAAGAGIAATQLHGHRGPMRADTNGDGIVSRAEFFIAAESRFKTRDADGNRMLTGSELTDKRGRFARQDADNDGRVTFAEVAGRTTARFAQLDADKDGKLTPEELGPGRGPGRLGRGMGMGGQLRVADTDNDGRITRDEMRAEADRRFDRLDANKDGAIDRAELQAMRGPRGPGGPGARDQMGDGPPPPPAPGSDD